MTPGPDSEQPIYYTTVRRLAEPELRQRLSGSPEQVARIVYAAATGGSAAAQVTLGQMLLDGHGMKRDAAAALRWFEIAAKAGDLDGINMLGRCYENGWGILIDRNKAKEQFQKAAAKSHPWAQFNLGMLLLHDSGRVGDVATALALFVHSARQGNAKAMNMIGRYREFGWTGRINHGSALRWYRRAAVRGCFRGAAHLARFLHERSKPLEAVHWYRRSAANAPTHFCRELAAHLFATDDAALHGVAREALKRAAEDDDPADLFAYANVLIQGQGGPVDLAEAKIWLGRAQSLGFPGALLLLEETRRKRDLL